MIEMNEYYKPARRRKTRRTKNNSKISNGGGMATNYRSLTQKRSRVSPLSLKRVCKERPFSNYHVWDEKLSSKRFKFSVLKKSSANITTTGGGSGFFTPFKLRSRSPQSRSRLFTVKVENPKKSKNGIYRGSPSRGKETSLREQDLKIQKDKLNLRISDTGIGLQSYNTLKVISGYKLKSIAKLKNSLSSQKHRGGLKTAVLGFESGEESSREVYLVKKSKISKSKNIEPLPGQTPLKTSLDLIVGGYRSKYSPKPQKIKNNFTGFLQLSSSHTPLKKRIKSRFKTLEGWTTLFKNSHISDS